MKKLLFIFLWLISAVAFSQPNLKYSGFFDSYYTTGPLKYYVEPGITMMNGELAKSKFLGGIGAGVNYRILPPVHLNASVRYLSLQSKDHDDKRASSFTGSKLQFNVIGNYHFVYDVVRTSRDRRRGPKKINAYALFGLSFNLLYSANPVAGNAALYNTNIVAQNGTIANLFSNRAQTLHFPVGLGMPIRITPRFTFVPEVAVYLTKVIPFIQNGSDLIDGIQYNGDKRVYNDTYTFINFKFMFNPKGKRLHPKQPVATNRGSTESSGGGGDFSDDSDDDNGFDSFDTDDDNDGMDNLNSDDGMDIEDDVIEEGTDEDEIIEEDEFDEEGDEEEGDEEGEKYDEDGFLIDD